MEVLFPASQQVLEYADCTPSLYRVKTPSSKKGVSEVFLSNTSNS